MRRSERHALYVDYSDSLNKHTLQAVLAGSLRAPDRLKAAYIIEDDICVTCGVRCTTAHVFWERSLYKAVRQPFQDAIAKLLGDQKRHKPATFKRISKGIKQACFINCGLCPGDERGWAAYHKLSEDSDPDMVAPVAIERITSSCSDSGWITLNDYKYLLAYTDGSALHSSDRLSARAGWGVWYSEQSPFNAYEVSSG